jgi:hypothetical protein
MIDGYALHVSHFIDLPWVKRHLKSSMLPPGKLIGQGKLVN